jgi:hypothetical protein
MLARGRSRHVSTIALARRLQEDEHCKDSIQYCPPTTGIALSDSCAQLVSGTTEGRPTRRLPPPRLSLPSRSLSAHSGVISDRECRRTMHAPSSEDGTSSTKDVMPQVRSRATSRHTGGLPTSLEPALVMSAASSAPSSRDSSPSPVPSVLEPVTPECGTAGVHSPFHPPVDSQDDCHTSVEESHLSPEDRIQNAYAVDMRLAKLLLLQYRGSSAHSLTDPRIDAIYDADFDEVFPKGAPEFSPCFEERLRAEQEAVARRREEQERQSAVDDLWAQREQWAARVERRWKRMGRMMHEERELARAARAEREQMEAHVRDERERRRAAAAEARTVRLARKQQKKAAKAGSSDEVSRRVARSEVIDICPALVEDTPSSAKPRWTVASSSRVAESDTLDASTPMAGPSSVRGATRSTSPTHTPEEVTMQDVFQAMHGSLFNEAPEEAQQVRDRYLDEMLEPVAWNTGERWPAYRRLVDKGKAKAIDEDPPSPPLRRSSSGSDPCAACIYERTAQLGSVPSSPSLQSMHTTDSRASGWLSFQSGSRSQLSTAPTSVVSSVTSTKGTSRFSLASELRNRLLRGKSIPLMVARPTAVSRCSCKPLPRATVLPGACPLSETPSHGKDRAPNHALDAVMLAPVKRPAFSPALSGHWKLVRQSVAGFVDAAQRLQEAYVRATVVSSPLYGDIDPYGYRGRPSSSSPSRSRSRTRTVSPYRRLDYDRGRHGHFPPGYRVYASEVLVFLGSGPVRAPPAVADGVELPGFRVPGVCTIVLRALPGAPRKRMFAPLPSPPRSPLRPRYAPRSTEGRYRPVENCAHLRLRALANVCAARGISWEDPPAFAVGVLPGGPGALASGTERIRGVAFDGVGRSALRGEVQSAEERASAYVPLRMTVPRRRLG